MSFDIESVTSSDGVPEATTSKLELDRLEQVVRLIRDFEVGITGDAEPGALVISISGKSSGRKCAITCSRGRNMPRSPIGEKRGRSSGT